MTPAAERSVVAVGSGKGGVGKSTVTLQLALACARRGSRVGILDADLYGPDIPLMVGISRQEQARQWQLWRRGGGATLQPIERHGLRLMSAGFLLAESQALTMGAPLLTAALRQLVVEVAWGELDLLFVDLPPGTADLQQQLVQVVSLDGAVVVVEVAWGELDVLFVDLPPGTADLQQQLVQVVSLDGAVVVVGPQDVAHLDARKFLAFVRDAGVPVLGGIENMAGLVCPHCGERIDVFPQVAEERAIWADGVPLLGRVPLDPALGAEPAEPKPVFDPLAERLLDELGRRRAA